MRIAGLASAMMVGCSILLAARAGAATPPPSSVVVVTNPRGASLSLSPKSPNFSPPAVELRCGHRVAPWLVPEIGVALLVLPEHIPELRIGTRIHAFAGAQHSIVRDFFARPGAQILLTTAGTDGGPGLEIGLALRGGGLLGLVSLGSNYYVRRPRLVAELRLGVGFQF